MKWILFPLVFLQVACASESIIRDHQYQRANEAYGRQDLSETFEKFPQGEAGGFVTSVEKSWLDVWRERFDTKILQQQVDTFDERKFTSISREAGYFFTQESEEGYVPAEHEVVVLHLISAIQFHQNGKTEDAKVELRRASYMLDHVWDDSALRIWLGTLWASFGDWDQAQVDFRRANELTPDPNLKKLANSARPKKLTLHFFGNGPLMKWHQGQFAPEFLQDNAPRFPVDVERSTLPWFARHTQRNTELREIMVKSNYMTQYVGGKALKGTEYGMTKTLTTGIKVVGVAVGAALVAGLIYIAAKSNLPGDGLAYGLTAAVGVGAGIWDSGVKLDTDFSSEIEKDDERRQRDLRTYRMVRFLPTWIGLEIGDKAGLGTAVRIKPVPAATETLLVNHF